VYAPWLFDERAAAVVHALKYQDRPALAAPLGTEMATALPGAWRRPDLVLEVPLHAARLRERGYNQSAVLADALADALGAPRWPGALRRTRATRPQARLGPRERRANLEGAFAIERPAWLRGRRVLVVDDVLTTGATLDATLAALHDAGAVAAGVALAWAQ
jgi:ComF family protein